MTLVQRIAGGVMFVVALITFLLCVGLRALAPATAPGLSPSSDASPDHRTSTRPGDGAWRQPPRGERVQ